MKTHPDEYAFPISESEKSNGLSILEYLAAAALQGLCSNANFTYGVDVNPKKVAGVAVQMARTLIEELNRKED